MGYNGTLGKNVSSHGVPPARRADCYQVGSGVRVLGKIAPCRVENRATAKGCSQYTPTNFNTHPAPATAPLSRVGFRKDFRCHDVGDALGTRDRSGNDAVCGLLIVGQHLVAHEHGEILVHRVVAVVDV